MEKIIFSLIDYMMGFIEVVMYYGFMSARFGKTQNHPVNKRWMMYIIGGIGVYITKPLGVSWPLVLIIHIVILLCIAHYAFKKDILEEAIFTIFYLVILYLLDLLVITVFGGNNPIVNQLMDYQTTYFYIQLGLISKLLLIGIVKIFIELEKNKLYQLTPQVRGLMGCGFFISLISIYFLSVVFFKVLGSISGSINLFITLTAVGIFLDNIIIYYTVQKLSDWINKEKEYEVVQYQNEVLIKATLEKDEMNKEVRKIWHDFNNHMSCIDMLLQMGNIEKARAYIKNMNASCQTTYMGIKTGNEMADVVINQKFMLAKAQNIDLIVSGGLDEELNINQMDLCALLCNSLDNAIEACRQIEDKEKRKASLSLKMHKEYLLIDVSNSVKKEAMDNKQLITTKKDKSRHGIGMLSMRTIVEKYGGNLEWKYENNQFLLSIMIKNVLL
ncbi:GHKL domain-containing protein [Cellulosilyticum sp. ST5]|uniref:sensor histidine kinase n=1 Tax=unclassified Cellulosilyticum TaxID=2643091 RepID=UPI000F8D67AC|nr:sensor histidine kinase [Cellulosilyticum sp. WCF-2]QEH68992.1 GHKL domain-containing protein [Cellulosilyticum sp. WCF-2]